MNHSESGDHPEAQNGIEPGPVPSPAAPRSRVLFAGSRPAAPNGFGGNSERNWLPWIVAAIVVVFLAAIAFILGGRRVPASPATIDPYAAQLVFSHVHVSQASNFAGDQLTYVDGTVSNHGNRTVTFLTVRVLFASLTGEPPQVEQLPLNLIRTREPYVDTEPISAAPLKPGSSQEFRLIFDHVSPDWNQQPPQVQVQSLTLRH